MEETAAKVEVREEDERGEGEREGRRGAAVTIGPGWLLALYSNFVICISRFPS